MKGSYILKWLLAILITGLLVYLSAVYPAFPKELLPVIGLVGIVIILKIFQSLRK